MQLAPRWNEYLKGSDPNPPTHPTVVLIGCRPFDPSVAHLDPACPVCKGSIPPSHEGFYCAQCERSPREIEDVLKAAVERTKVKPWELVGPGPNEIAEGVAEPEDAEPEIADADADAKPEPEARVLKTIPAPPRPDPSRPLTRRERRALQFKDRRHEPDPPDVDRRA